jgi:hypothetical protein
MKAQIENLKQELREFLKLSKTITKGRWAAKSESIWAHSGLVCSGADTEDIIFIARSRKVSPLMAECLLGQIEWLEQYAVPVESANQQLQEILNLWEAAK